MAEALPKIFHIGVRLRDITLDAGGLTAAIYYSKSTPGGAFGRVFRGTWRGLRVAVKVISSATPRDIFDKEASNLCEVKRLIDKARIHARNGLSMTEPCHFHDRRRPCPSHDLRGYNHLVYVYGIGSEPDLAAISPGLPREQAYLIVMEELSGGTLEEMAALQPLRPPQALRILEVASGLAALAAAHVVHADIKPANIMFRLPGGEAVLTDYGVSFVADVGLDTSHRTGCAVGTTLYLAPELLDGVCKNTYATDMWALAMAVYEALTGWTPWADGPKPIGRLPSSQVVLSRLLEAGERPDLRPVTDLGAPGEIIADIFRRCWARHSRNRPQASTLFDDLTALRVRGIRGGGEASFSRILPALSCPPCVA